MTRHARGPEPADAVVAAYGAANRGHYSRANAFLAPTVRKELLQAHALAVTTGKILRRALAQLEGRRGEVVVRTRQTLRALIKSNKLSVSTRMGSGRFLGRLWRAATRGRSILKIETTRQVIRGSRARVYLRLKLRDGTVVKDSEPLLLHRGRWLLG
jgi:RNase P/RNase MRP subunit p29